MPTPKHLKEAAAFKDEVFNYAFGRIAEVSEKDKWDKYLRTHAMEYLRSMVHGPLDHKNVHRTPDYVRHTVIQMFAAAYVVVSKRYNQTFRLPGVNHSQYQVELRIAERHYQDTKRKRA